MRVILTALAILSIATTYSQTQTFASKGFKVNCECKLRVNTSFISLMESQSTDKVYGAYTCAKNNSDPEAGIIYNINIYDFSKDYIKMQRSQYLSYEESFLRSYAKGLAENNITYYYVTYLGVSAIQYDFDQMGLPTKAIMFIKNKKSYLLQVATNLSLVPKFNSFKNSFSLL